MVPNKPRPTHDRSFRGPNLHPLREGPCRGPKVAVRPLRASIHAARTSRTARPHGGKSPAEDRKWLCDHCGLPFMPPEPPGPPAPIVVWSYPGRTQVDAGQVYAKHAVELAAQGYVPIAQSWAEGRPGGG